MTPSSSQRPQLHQPAECCVCSVVLSRPSSEEESMMRDRLITSGSFQHGLTTLGFKLSEEASRDRD